MEFRILGPLEVHVDGRVVALGGAKPRALLAVLLLNANEPVSAGRLALALWGEDAPAGAVKTVQVHVSRLRKALGDPDVLETAAAGYRLRVRPRELDSERFEGLVADGRRTLLEGRPEEAAAVLREALSLWRGPPLADLATLPFAPGEITRLEEQRLGAVEARAEADLAAGRHAELVAELQQLTGLHPWRERLHAQRMLALYRCGRQAEALEVYRDTRRLLAEELGLEPGEELRRLEQQMLAQAPELDPPQRTAPAAPPGTTQEAPPARARRVVSVVFAGIADPGALAERLDAESLHALLDRYCDICATVVERHGGAVEALTGDAVVGLFGLDRAREDDALRAVRAGVEIREAIAALSAGPQTGRRSGLAPKVGVDSGEVFVGAGARRQSFATGEPVTVAAALSEAAAAGEILLGDRTRRLAAAAVRVEPVDQASLPESKAWRLLELRAEESAARPLSGSPFVGRERELDELRTALGRAAGEPACRLVTVVGSPGIGKSRLASELVVGLGGRARAVVGRCAPYGEDSTFAALAEIVRQLAGGDSAGELEQALGGGDQALAAARMLLAALGLGDEPAHPEEIAWAVRRLFERAARERPLVVVVEDIHWAGPSLLDLLEYVEAFSTGAPIVLLCLARPELFETRPSWAAPQRNRSEIVLEPLSPALAGELVERLGAGVLQPDTADRIVETAEGNPLFVEQLVAVAPGSDAAAVPLSLQTVLAARIDRLEPGERAVLGYGSVEGRSFHAGAVGELLPESERRAVGAHLLSLVRKQLLRAERSELEGEDAFRFGHVLIRDAAYDAMPKRLRAELHERLAGWLEQRARPHDAVVGHHVEQACRLWAELGSTGDRERALAREGADRLADAARAALMRGDPPAAARLLERAAALLAADDPGRVELLPRLGSALFEAGRLEDADAILAEAVERAVGQDRADLAARARVERQFVRLQTEVDTGPGESRRVAESALRILAEHGDDVGQCRAWCLRAWIDWTQGRAASADEAWREAADHARRAHDERELFETLCWRASAAVFGPTPVQAAIRRCDAIREQVKGSPVAVAVTLHPLASLHAMQGDSARARQLIREGNEILDELGRMQSAVSHHEALVELLAGSPAAAEERLRRGYDTLERMGERGLLATTAAMLAQAVYAQGRLAEADELCAASQAAAPREDLVTQVMWRGVRAKVRAGLDGADEAEALVREALELIERTDLLTHHGDTLLDLAEVERLRGRPVEAETAARRALELYERKGNLVSAQRARSWLASGGGDQTMEVDGGAALAVRQAGDARG